MIFLFLLHYIAQEKETFKNVINKTRNEYRHKVQFFAMQINQSDRGSRIADRGSRIANRGSRIGELICSLSVIIYFLFGIFMIRTNKFDFPRSKVITIKTLLCLTARRVFDKVKWKVNSLFSVAGCLCSNVVVVVVGGVSKSTNFVVSVA